MLDVHPPHSPTHTWQDFFIHIATIVVGLLIAVGLEQTVEALHHRHQRHELEAGLREDGVLNQRWAKQDLDAVLKLREWSQRQALAVEAAGGSGPLMLPALSLDDISTPNFGIFHAAQANGQLSLLSSWQQNMQADLNRVVDQIFVSDLSYNTRLRSSLGELNELLVSHAVQQTGGTLDVSSLNADQRAQLAQRLSAVSESARQMESVLIVYATENELLLENPEVLIGPEEFEMTFQRIEGRFVAAHKDTQYSFTVR